MRGTCQRCGCTDERACSGGCDWADEWEDLCDSCAVQIVGEPVPESDLAGLRLHFRAFAAISICAIARLREEQDELRQLLQRAAGERADDLGTEVTTIWTPSLDRET